MRQALPIAVLAALWGASCATAGAEPSSDAQGSGPDRAQESALRSCLEALYAAFDFEPGGEPDWEVQRELFCVGASFFAPTRGAAPALPMDAAAFLASFGDWVRSPRMAATGFHEEITHARIELYGNVAHTWVAFEGFIPPAGVAAAGGAEAAAARRTRGVDSIQWVRDAERWKLASFATHYAPAGEELPGRFAR